MADFIITECTGGTFRKEQSVSYVLHGFLLQTKEWTERRDNDNGAERRYTEYFLECADGRGVKFTKEFYQQTADAGKAWWVWNRIDVFNSDGTKIEKHNLRVATLADVVTAQSL